MSNISKNSPRASKRGGDASKKPRSPQQSLRVVRVATMVRQVVAELLLHEVKDPRVKSVSIVDAEMTPDLREARIYYIVSEESQRKEAERGLEQAKGFIQRKLGQQVELRVVPLLSFRYDHSLEYGQRIEQKLFELGLGEAAQTAARSSESEVDSDDDEDLSEDDSSLDEELADDDSSDEDA